jgi:aspartyl-tRNA(Asn)/glutamyl-tRNA(Gln) amidotransferase subunit C
VGRTPRSRRRILAVIDHDEVLHVARLARLQLGEDEVESMAGELSAVLDHIAKIGELDLDGVAPTSHVVEVSGALRHDEPRPSLPREVALAQAPSVSGEGFMVPSPQA